MITITEQKPLDEIMQQVDRCKGIYIIGCGTCTTMQHTGGKTEVLDMKETLEKSGKKVTGWMVIPTACDPLTKDALAEKAEALKITDCFLIMTCAFGVQTVNMYTDKPVYPALNTLFIGKEESPGKFVDICMQCGNCVLGRTAGICPLVRCAKSLLNGPCGGSVDGKCEVSPDIPCAWQLIVDRLAEQGRLDDYEKIEPPRDWDTSQSGVPRQMNIET